MVSTAPSPPAACDDNRLAGILSDEERTFVSLVSEMGPDAGEIYFDLVAQYQLPISLIALCRKGFAKCSTVYLAGDQQCRHEVAKLQDLIPRLGRVKDTWLAQRYELPIHTVRTLRLHRGITSFDFTGQVPEFELGITTDKAMAQKYGIPTYVVTTARRAIGISAVAAGETGSSEAKRTSLAARAQGMPELVSRLGTAPDSQLASEAGVPRTLVYALRTHLGISKFSPYQKMSQDNPELVARLGVSSDKELASEFGLPYHCVHELRHHLGIDRYSKDGGARNVTPDFIEMFKASSLDEMVKRTGKTKNALRAIKKALDIPHFKPPSVFTEEVINALGTAPDPEIASRFGIDRAHLARHRIKLGIKPFTKVGRPAAPVPAGLPALLGTLPDSEVAKQFGLSTITIKKRRRERGIPPYKRTSKRLIGSISNVALLG